MTARLTLALVFVLAWALVTGSFSAPNLLFGALIGGAAALLTRDGRRFSPLPIRPLRLVRLAGLFLVELIKSGLRVAAVVLRPQMKVAPGIVAVPLRLERDFEIALLANLITLTPGTLSVDVSPDKRVLYVHCVDMPDPDAVIADVRTGFEQRILEAFR